MTDTYVDGVTTTLIRGLKAHNVPCKASGHQAHDLFELKDSRS